MVNVTIGSAYAFTLTAQDQAGNTLKFYAGTVAFTSSDSLAILAAPATLRRGIGAFSATFFTAGEQTLTATDIISGISGSELVNAVQAGVVTHFAFSFPTQPLNIMVGRSQAVAITALDSFNNIAIGYFGTVHLTMSDSAAIFTPNLGMISGRGTYGITFLTAGTQFLTVTDLLVPTLTSTTSVQVNPGPGISVHLTGSNTAIAGQPTPYTLSAYDVGNNFTTNFNGTVRFTSSDTQAVFNPAVATLTNGLGNFTATLIQSGAQSITVIATPASGTTLIVIVSGQAEEDAVQLTVTSNLTVPAGVAQTVTVTAVDSHGSIVTTYAGTVTVTSTDTAAVLPSPSTLTNGVGLFTVTLFTAPNETIKAVGTSIINGNETVTVSPRPITHLQVTTQALAANNVAQSFTVVALDVVNGTVTGYTGTVQFSSSDTAAVFVPTTSTLTSGQGAFTVTFKTNGVQQLSAFDVNTPSISGSATATVSTVGTATQFVITSPSFFFGYVGTAFTVTAKDSGGNTVASYNGTVAFTSSDGCTATKLPANATLTNGIGVFSATLCSPLLQIITATDTVHATLTGNSGNITVGGIYFAQHFVENPGTLVSTSSPDGATFHTVPNLNYGAGAQAGGGIVRDPQPLEYNGKLWCAHTISFGVAGGLPGAAIGLVLATDGQHWSPVAGTGPTGLATLGYIDLSKFANGGATGFGNAWAPDWMVDINNDVYMTFTATTTGNFQQNVLYYIKCKTNPADMKAWTDPVAVTGATGSGFAFGVGIEDNGTIYYNNKWYKFWDTSLNGSNGATIGYQEQAAVSPNIATNWIQQENQVLQQNLAYLSGDILYRLTADNNGNGYWRLYLDNFFNGGGNGAGTVYVDQQAGAKDFTSGLAVASQNPWSAPVNVTVDGAIGNVRAMGVIIIPGSTVSLNVYCPSTASTGSGILATVTAYDSQNHLSPSYIGTVHFTSTDTAAVLPANATLSAGVGVFSVTFNTAGTRTVSAADISTPSIHGQSGNVTVATGALPATHYTILAPTDATSGVAAVITVTAADQTGATATAYTGTVHFTSSDTAATLPANTTLSAGVGVFSVTFNTTGNQTVTGTDVSSSITGVSGVVNVHAGALSLAHFLVNSGTTSVGATPIVYTVTAQTSGNATVTNYSGTVTFSSSDAIAKLPANIVLSNGVGVFSATLSTPGNQTITAADSVTSSLSGHSPAINVSGVYIAPYFGNTADESLHMGASSDGLNFYTWTLAWGTGGAPATVRDPDILPVKLNGAWWSIYGVGSTSSGLGAAGFGLSSSPDFKTWTKVTDNGCNHGLGNGQVSFGGSGFAFTLVPKWIYDGSTPYVVFGGSNSAAGSCLCYVTSPTNLADFTQAWNAPIQIATNIINSGTSAFFAHAITKYGGLFYLWVQYAANNWVPIASSPTITAGTWTSLLTGNWLNVSAAYDQQIIPAMDCTGWRFYYTMASVKSVYRTQSFSNTDWTSGLPLASQVAWSAENTIMTNGVSLANQMSMSAIVVPSVATNLGIKTISPATFGGAIEVVVTAQDFANLLSTSYTGTVTFTGGGAGAVLPANATLTNGIGLFSVTLNAHGTTTITVTDTVTSSITGASGGITV